MNSVSAPKIPLDAFDSSRCSVPYPWPVAGRWRADDTALLAIDMQKDFLDPRGYFASLRTHGTTQPFREAMLDFNGLNDLIGTPEMLAQGHRYESGN